MSDPSGGPDGTAEEEQQRLSTYLESLHQLAEVSLDVGRPLRLYARSADSVFKQACIYRNEQDLEKSFVLFLKFSKYPSGPIFRSDSLMSPS